MNLQFTVPNMACAACGETITKAVLALDPAAQVKTDPKTKLVEVDSQKSETDIKDAIAAAGYTIA